MSNTSSAKWPPSGLTGWLTRRVIPAGAAPDSPASRTALGEFEGYVSTAVSLFLSVTKFVMGGISGSVSLIADALNNLADIASSLIVAFGFRWSRKPRDREHPFGHGRVEAVTQLILSIILVGVSIEVARAGVSKLLHPEAISVPWWLTATIVITVLVKIWLATFARILARATGSQVLEADSWNHTYDILCTLLVVVALFGSRIGWLWLDGCSALGVSGFIAFTGIKYARNAINTLIGEAPSPAELARIRALAGRVEGVRGVHDVIVHTYGDVRLVSLHIEVDAHLSVLAAHELAERVESHVAEAFVARVIAHVDPVDRSHGAYGPTEAALGALVHDHPELVGFHDLRLKGPPDRFDLSVDLVAHADLQPEGFKPLLEEIRHVLHERVPGSQRIDLGMETEYASEHDHRQVFSR